MGTSPGEPCDGGQCDQCTHLNFNGQIDPLGQWQTDPYNAGECLFNDNVGKCVASMAGGYFDCVIQAVETTAAPTTSPGEPCDGGQCDQCTHLNFNGQID